MGWKPIFFFVVSSIYAWALAQTPTPGSPPPTPQQQGELMGQQTGNDVAANAQAGQTADAANYDSFYQSSVDNLTNSQKGQTVSTVMANGLNNASSGYNSACASAPPDDPSCYASSVLVAMAGQAMNSSSSFSPVIQDAWYNTCVYSTLACDAAPPNGYQSLLQNIPNNLPQQIGDQTESLIRRGFYIDNQNGIVRAPNGQKLYSNNMKSLPKSLGKTLGEKIMGTVKNIEQAAMDKVNRIPVASVKKVLGLSDEPEQRKKTMIAKRSAHRDGNEKKKKRSLAQIQESVRGQMIGMSRDFNGNPIGVSGDDIFRMIQHRYQMKRQENSFYNR